MRLSCWVKEGRRTYDVWDDPEDSGLGSPTKDEQTSREEKRPRDHQRYHNQNQNYFFGEIRKIQLTQPKLRPPNSSPIPPLTIHIHLIQKPAPKLARDEQADSEGDVV